MVFRMCHDPYPCQGRLPRTLEWSPPSPVFADGESTLTKVWAKPLRRRRVGGGRRRRAGRPERATGRGQAAAAYCRGGVGEGKASASNPLSRRTGAPGYPARPTAGVLAPGLRIRAASFWSGFGRPRLTCDGAVPHAREGGWRRHALVATLRWPEMLEVDSPRATPRDGPGGPRSRSRRSCAAA